MILSIWNARIFYWESAEAMQKEICKIYNVISEIHRVVLNSSANDAYLFYAERDSETTSETHAYWHGFLCSIQGGILYSQGLIDQAAEHHREAVSGLTYALANLDTQENVPGEERVYYTAMWTLLELGFDCVRQRNYTEVEEIYREFRRLTIQAKLIDAYNPHSIPEADISTEDPICLFGHHYALLKIIDALYRGELKNSPERVEKFLDLNKMAIAQRHFIEYRLLFMEMLANGHYNTANRLLSVMFEMLNTVSSLSLSRQYWLCSAEYFKAINDRENFLRAFEVLEKVTEARYEMSGKYKISVMKREESVFRHHMEQKRDEQKKKTLAYQAGTDVLTGLSNRYGVEEYGPEAVETAIEHKQSLTVLLIDIDRFKYFNDSFGHLIGDECIRRASTLIKDVFSGYFAARYSGDEFIVVLRDESMETIQELTGEFCRRLLTEKIPDLKNKSEYTMITVSQGAVFARPNYDTTWQELVAAADKTLRTAKHNGKDCIMISKYIRSAKRR